MKVFFERNIMPKLINIFRDNKRNYCLSSSIKLQIKLNSPKMSIANKTYSLKKYFSFETSSEIP